jgi:DNA-directed RNA polymerase specialized sigma24 family protein
LRFAVVLTGDRGLAEDVVQEVLLRVYERWAKIGELDQPVHYVRRMIVNEYLNWRRRWGRVTPRADPPLDFDPVADHAAVHAERDALRIELDVMRYYAGMSDTEIAEVLGCRAGTVRGYASRALAALRVERGLAPVKEHT